jgi:hypothetical protein
MTVWNEHLDINRIMLATSLAPDAFLDLYNQTGALICPGAC